ncbi:MAG TPA: hypothetical protein VH914_07795 [Acidimicrobiia bacterium]|jgi:hypothetical protein|nr:hypothetical protein [Acidimicrobiia bacterium]
MTDDPRSLRAELHDLASDVAASSGATTRARDRAHRGIVRHRRNQRAAVAGLATVVVLAGVTAAFALGHDSRHSAPPAHDTTTVAPSTTTTTAVANTAPPSTLPFVNRSPYAVPSVDQLTPANAVYSAPFAWGKADNQVSFATTGGEGASGGPAAFLADRVGNKELFDHSNGRLVFEPKGMAPYTRTLDLPSPAVTAAVFDGNAQHRLIAAFYNDLVVYDAFDGSKIGSFPGAGPSGPEITRLVVARSTVYSVAEDGALTAELHDDGSGYVPASDNAPLEPGAITITFHAPASQLDLSVSGNGRQYSFTGTDSVSTIDVRAARALPDGSLVLVLTAVQSDVSDPDRPRMYEIVRVDASGNATYTRVDAPVGYLIYGAEFVIDDTGVAAMSSTITGGVTISYYPF